MKHLTDAQQQLVITTIAKAPVPEAKPILLAKIQRRLPDTRVSDEQLIEAINDALASFTPGAYVADEHGAWRAQGYISPTQTLKEAADAYVRQLAIGRGTVQQVYWPPYPSRPAQPAESAESYTQWAARVSPEEHEAAADAYMLDLCDGDRELFARRKAEAEKHRAFITLNDLTPFPIDPSPPPRTPMIYGTVNRDPEPEHFPSDEDLRAMTKTDQPDDDGEEEMSPMRRVIEMSKKSKRGGLRRKFSDRVKVFFK